MSPALPTFLRLVTLAGILGLSVELLLLAHVDGALQWAPLALLGAAFLTVLAAGRRPGPRAILACRASLAALVIAGPVGMVLHYLGNREFQLELDPSLQGLALFAKVVRAHSPPALAPGAMILVGLAGFAWTLAVASGPRRSPNP